MILSLLNIWPIGKYNPPVHLLLDSDSYNLYPASSKAHPASFC